MTECEVPWQHTGRHTTWTELQKPKRIQIFTELCTVFSNCQWHICKVKKRKSAEQKNSCMPDSGQKWFYFTASQAIRYLQGRTQLFLFSSNIILLAQQFELEQIQFTNSKSLSGNSSKIQPIDI